MERVNKPVCCVCGEPADTVRGGRDYCAKHDLQHTPEVPLVLCEIDGCGSPAVLGGRCTWHARRAA